MTSSGFGMLCLHCCPAGKTKSQPASFQERSRAPRTPEIPPLTSPLAPSPPAAPGADAPGAETPGTATCGATADWPPTCGSEAAATWDAAGVAES